MCANVLSQWFSGRFSIRSVLAALVGTVGFMITVGINLDPLDYQKLWFLVILLVLLILLYWLHCMLLVKLNISDKTLVVGNDGKLQD